MQFFGHRKDQARGEEINPQPDHDAVKDAYDLGRRDERAARRRRRRPLAAVAVAVLALTGAGVTGLAAVEGSFASSGQIIDRQVAMAASHVQAARRDASASLSAVDADRAG